MGNQASAGQVAVEVCSSKNTNALVGDAIRSIDTPLEKNERANTIATLIQSKQPLNEITKFIFIPEYFDLQILKYLVIVGGANFDTTLNNTTNKLMGHYKTGHQQWKILHDTFSNDKLSEAELTSAIKQLTTLDNECLGEHYSGFRKCYAEHSERLQKAQQILQAEKSAPKGGITTHQRKNTAAGKPPSSDAHFKMS